ncbi:hypothetical protein BSKO_05780 [Bryopsis sp. KO-2023]|nr:hypothetical protein BSKO_05780 [Bryopsis sp. KO-2023]
MNEEFLPENIHRSSRACISLSRWVQSVYAYHKASQQGNKLIQDERKNLMESKRVKVHTVRSLQGRRTSELLETNPTRILGNQEPQSAVLHFKDFILAGLMDIFDLADIKQIMEHGEKRVDRLHRLDAIMSEYQKMTPEL